jgi:hypothetical protein
MLTSRFNKKPIEFISVIFAMAVVLLLILIALNSYFWLDDFLIRLQLQEENIFERIWRVYFNWDGRSIAPFYIMGDLNDGYGSAELSSILTTGLFFVSSYLLARCFLFFWGNQFFSGFYLFLLTLLIVVVLWLGFSAHLSRSFYWTCTSKYTNANLLGILWVYLLFKHTNQTKLLLLVSFLMTISGFNIAVAGLTIFVFLKVFKLQKINLKNDILILLVLIAGTSFALFAPGNFVRAEATHFEMNTSVASLTKGFFQIAKEYLFMSKWIFIGALIITLFSFFTRANTVDNKQLILKYSVVFFLASFSTIVPFTPIPETASKHTGHFFQLLLFIALVLLFYYFSCRFVFNKYILSQIVFILTTLWFVWVSKEQYVIGKNIKTQILNRYSYLESKRGSVDTVFINPIQLPDKFFTNRFWETTNNTNWGFEVLQQYFGTGPVVLKEIHK